MKKKKSKASGKASSKASGKAKGKASASASASAEASSKASRKPVRERKPLTSEQRAVLIARLAKARAAKGMGGPKAATKKVLRRANKGATGADIETAAERVERTFAQLEPVFNM